jgi:hypothetical protein
MWHVSVCLCTWNRTRPSGYSCTCQRWITGWHGRCGWTSKGVEGRLMLCIPNAAGRSSQLLSVQGNFCSVHFVGLIIVGTRAFPISPNGQLLCSACRRRVHSFSHWIRVPPCMYKENEWLLRKPVVIADTHTLFACPGSKQKI